LNDEEDLEMQKSIPVGENMFHQEEHVPQPTNSSSFYSLFKNPLENLFESTSSKLLGGNNK